MLQQLKQELQSSITYSYFDNFKSLHDIISNPARYGTSKQMVITSNENLDEFIPRSWDWKPNQTVRIACHDIDIKYYLNFVLMYIYIVKQNVVFFFLLILGFTDVTSACCGNGKLNADTPCLPITRYCSDRTKYLFWDRYGHPTEAAARTFIDLMLSDDSQYSTPLTLSQLVSS